MRVYDYLDIWIDIKEHISDQRQRYIKFINQDKNGEIDKK
jgi:hypothetical protein